MAKGRLRGKVISILPHPPTFLADDGVRADVVGSQAIDRNLAGCG